MSKNLTSSLFLFALLLGLFSDAAAVAQKPKGGSSLPPVRYQVQFWTVPGISAAVEDSNDSGQSVGGMTVDLNGDGIADTYHGFLYDSNVDANSGFNLNAMVANIPPGWVIRKAMAINESGRIAVYIAPVTAGIGSPDQVQAAMVDLNVVPPALYAIPDGALTSFSVAYDINDLGDITASFRRQDGTWGQYVYNFDTDFGIAEPYDLGVTTTTHNKVLINNLRQVAGRLADGWTSYRLNLGGGFETFPGAGVYAINENGAISGLAKVGRQNTLKAFLQTTAFETFDTTGSEARDLNDSLDFITSTTLYHRSYGATNVRNLLDPTDPDSNVLKNTSPFYLSTIGNRDALTQFPTVTGTAGGVQVTLTPVRAP